MMINKLRIMKLICEIITYHFLMQFVLLFTKKHKGYNYLNQIR